MRSTERPWRASAGEDLDAEHGIFDHDVICDYSHSNKRICGQVNLQALRGNHPGKPSGFENRRMLGKGELWITEYVIQYGGSIADTVSVMQFRNGRVIHETQYFAGAFKATDWRAQWVERLPDSDL
jgi:hypothetical protein